MTYSEVISAMRKTASPDNSYLAQMARPIRKEDVPVPSRYPNPEAVKTMVQQRMAPIYRPSAMVLAEAKADGLMQGFSDIANKGNADVINAGKAVATGTQNTVNAIGPLMHQLNPFRSRENRIADARTTLGPTLTAAQTAARQQAVATGQGVDDAIRTGEMERTLLPPFDEVKTRVGGMGSVIRAELTARRMNDQMDAGIASVLAEARRKRNMDIAGTVAGAAGGGLLGYGAGALFSKNKAVRLLSALTGAGAGGYLTHKALNQVPKAASLAPDMRKVAGDLTVTRNGKMTRYIDLKGNAQRSVEDITLTNPEAAKDWLSNPPNAGVVTAGIYGQPPDPSGVDPFAVITDQTAKDNKIRRDNLISSGIGTAAGAVGGGALGYGAGALLSRNKGIRLLATLLGAGAGGYAGNRFVSRMQQGFPKTYA